MRLRIKGCRDQLWQWDTGRELEVIGAEGCTEVHFARPGDKDALTLQIREADGIRVVSVPDVILQRSGQFVAFLCTYDDTGAETRYANRFYAKPRPKPADYVYTPEETKSWKRLSDRIDTLETMIPSPATAEVGQTIVVTEVDGNGKPTKWKAADYQPRTHYEGKIVLVPETIIPGGCGNFPDFVPIVGHTYDVEWNGTVYPVVAIDVSSAFDVPGAIWLGNAEGYIEGVESNGEPFIVMYDPSLDPGERCYCCWWDGSILDDIILKITEDGIQKIDAKFIPELDLPEEYGSIEKTVVVPEQQLTLTASGDYYKGYLSEGTFTPIADTMYDVVWNGTVYTVTAEKYIKNKLVYIRLGNKKLIGGEDTGEPFFIQCLVDSDIYSTDVNPTVEIIECIGTKIHKALLPTKLSELGNDLYSPDNPIPASCVESDIFTLDLTEILDAFPATEGTVTQTISNADLKTVCDIEELYDAIMRNQARLVIKTDVSNYTFIRLLGSWSRNSKVNTDLYPGGGTNSNGDATCSMSEIKVSNMIKIAATLSGKASLFNVFANTAKLTITYTYGNTDLTATDDGAGNVTISFGGDV